MRAGAAMKLLLLLLLLHFVQMTHPQDQLSCAHSKNGQ